MPVSVDKERQFIELQLPDLGTTKLAWFHNRLHLHPRVHRLQFEGLDSVPAADLAGIVEELLEGAMSATGSSRPLLFRITVELEDPILTTLGQLGFLEARRVFERTLRLEEYTTAPAPGWSKSRHQLISLAAAIKMFDAARLTALFLEIYARGSKLDPATPEMLTQEQQDELLLGDSEIDLDISTCAIDATGPVGLFPVFRTDTPALLEVGPFGVAGDYLALNQSISLRMLDRVVTEAGRGGYERLGFEIDADDPFTVYLCAELPLCPNKSFVSLMYCPAWRDRDQQSS